MADIIYITDNLVLMEEKLYYYQDEHKKRITTKNMISYFNELDWFEIDEEWSSIILNLLQKKNNPYLIKDCGGNGDCLFYCVAEAFNNICQFPENLIEPKYTMEQLRYLTTEEINQDNFPIILETYKCNYDENEMIEDWNPYDIQNIDDLKNLLKISWGDHIQIQLLQDAIKTNIIIFNNYIFSDNTNNISSLGSCINKYPHYIFLYYIDNIHFQLIGKYNGKYLETIFKSIPKEIKQLINT